MRASQEEEETESHNTDSGNGPQEPKIWKKKRQRRNGHRVGRIGKNKPWKGRVVARRNVLLRTSKYQNPCDSYKKRTFVWFCFVSSDLISPLVCDSCIFGSVSYSITVLILPLQIQVWDPTRHCEAVPWWVL